MKLLASGSAVMRAPFAARAANIARPVALMLASMIAATPAAAASCDRQCLLDLTNRYVEALAAHDPKRVPLTDDVKFVENVTPMRVGEGLWTTTTGGATRFAIPVPDPINQTAGWLGMIENKGAPAMIAIRLKLRDGKIAEAEHLITTIRPEQMERVQTVRPGLLTDVPADKRKSHAELIALGASYYDALDDNDGTRTPFAADCERHENGMITAGPGPSVGAGPNNAGSAPIARDCAGQLTSNVMAYITKIDNRRVFAADPVTGLVMGLSHFRHPMDFEPYPVKALDGSTIMYDTKRLPFKPFDLPAAHVYKIGADGKMHEIEAMGFQTTLNAPTGWE